MFLGPYWWIIIPGILLGLYAQFKISSAYARYSRVPTNRGLTGAEAAREVLDSSGLQNVEINEVGGHLTDHYDPMKRALFLSSENYHGQHIAAVGVAAHEAGHALQHAAVYAPLHLRMALVPITNFASSAIYIMWIASIFLHMSKLATIGVVLFAILFLFHLVTLPVEIDASSRAKKQLVRLGIIADGQERSGVSRMLGAAALTYVAGLVTALLTLIQFILMARGNNRD